MEYIDSKDDQVIEPHAELCIDIQGCIYMHACHVLTVHEVMIIDLGPQTTCVHKKA